MISPASPPTEAAAPRTTSPPGRSSTPPNRAARRASSGTTWWRRTGRRPRTRTRHPGAHAGGEVDPPRGGRYPRDAAREVRREVRHPDEAQALRDHEIDLRGREAPVLVVEEGRIGRAERHIRKPREPLVERPLRLALGRDVRRLREVDHSPPELETVRQALPSVDRREEEVGRLRRARRPDPVREGGSVRQARRHAAERSGIESDHRGLQLELDPGRPGGGGGLQERGRERERQLCREAREPPARRHRERARLRVGHRRHDRLPHGGVGWAELREIEIERRAPRGGRACEDEENGGSEAAHRPSGFRAARAGRSLPTKSTVYERNRANIALPGTTPCPGGTATPPRSPGQAFRPPLRCGLRHVSVPDRQSRSTPRGAR